MAKKIKLNRETPLDIIPDDPFPKTTEEFFDLLNRVVDGDKSAKKRLKTVLEIINQDEELKEAMKKDLTRKDPWDEDPWDEDPWDEDPMEEDWFQVTTLLLPREDVKEYHIRIKLNDIDRKIWREIKVPSNMTLEAFSFLLVDVMGWYGGHMFCLRMKEKVYCSDMEIAENEFEDSYDFSEYTISDVLKEKGDKMKFEYDYGDGWVHDVWVKGIREYEKDEPRHIVFIKGFGACPPEDCGGVWGYQELLDLREKKRKTKDEKERLKWYKMSKDFYFDPDDCDDDYIRVQLYEWNERLNNE